jgi:hypothetical protein
MQSGRLKTTLCWITIFGIAVGYLESSVVIYLRELYYPSGFTFPLSTMSEKIAFIEVLREVSTLIILLSIAHLVGKNPRQRFAWFLYCFAIWDIFYYVFLKLMIGWPESLLTWDILFLIPTTWTGPVIAPVIVSLTMILMAAVVLFIDVKTPLFKISWFAAIVLIIGAGLIFLSFIWDYSQFMLHYCKVSGLFRNEVIQEAIQHYIPFHFNWWLYGTGLLFIYAGLYKILYQALMIFKRK